MALQRPKGTQDQLPDGSPKLKSDVQASAFAYVISTAQRLLERSGAKRINTPIFEDAELVKRGVGGSTDIVRKEMFTVTYAGTHGGYILRPEGTAGIVRAYLENGLKQLPSPLKLWTDGPMFRAENVQKGRLRQFHQVDYEVIGSTSALIDAEAIWLMVHIVRELGLTSSRIKLGSIGDPADRDNYNAYLRELFTPQLERLSDDSKDRLIRNPMRILDSKSKDDQVLITELNVKPMLDFLSEDAQAHFDQVRSYLDTWEVPYDLDPSIVRGLDYYRRTAWELHHEGVGAKSALGGGGRYDGLSAQLGGLDTPAIGWAFGIERVLIALDAEGIQLPLASGPVVFVAALDDEHVGLAAQVALQVRSDHSAEFAYRALKPVNVFKEAERRRARYAALIGSQEAERGSVMLKDLTTGQQREVMLSDLSQLIALENA